MKNIAIIGAGQMGSGIAQVSIQSGFSVKLFDINENQIAKGVSLIEKGLSKLVSKNIITESDKNSYMANLTTTTDFNSLSESELVIEAVSENKELKISIIKMANKILNDDAIFATNTSSISITELAAYYKKPSNFAGLHFMNPVPLMKLIELIRAIQTSHDIFKKLYDFTKELNKTAVVSEDSPGFIVNRILFPMINEAIFVLAEGIATAKDIDTAMKLGTNQPMGPLELADFIGLDTSLSILETLYDGFKDPKYRPAALLKKYVAAGFLGKKTGKGFYNY
ncbi:3-hydroxybutyryl-CoA dehydrogenase [bacterium]|nr:3-hydroxybutyryl-CoA dehydrogenase [bacterium]